MAPRNITINLSVTESKKGIMNIPPKEIPVRARLNTHNLIFPNLLDNGIHSGTDKAEGSMYAKMIIGAQAGASTIY
jgi:hypothetical protein